MNLFFFLPQEEREQKINNLNFCLPTDFPRSRGVLFGGHPVDRKCDYYSPVPLMRCLSVALLLLLLLSCTANDL